MNEKFVLGEASGRQRISGLTALKQHSCLMAAACRRRLLVYSHRLNVDIYNQVCFSEAVKNLGIRHANTRILLLVADTAELLRGGNRLVQFAQSMPSSIEIRHRAEEFEGDQRSFMLADEQGYILRSLWSDPDNIRVDYNNPYEVRSLKDDFMHIWEHSEPDPGLRHLHI
jgi:hypothetical protein